ncbi:MAG TPA: hypothetical protein VN712_03070, partial [Dermatophilaceae bacterium]|nr:hypothetical protein [Dermatophilaceae bacterium]
VNSLICNLIAPPTGGMSYLEPLQQALAGAGSAFNCSSELASFAALQGNSTTPSVLTPPNGTSPTSGANSAGSAAANQVYGMIGQPDTSKPSTLGGILNQLLGGPS